MIKKLNLQEIEHLHQFVRKHYVEFYDVELELVDHLANDIKTQWQTNNNISFERALDIEFKKFGVFGFSDILDFFTIPRIFISLAVFGILLVTGIKFNDNISFFYGSLVLILSLLYAYFGVKFTREIKQKQKGEQKKWLLNTVATQSYFGGPVISILPQIILQFSRIESGLILWKIVLFSFLILMFGLWILVSIFQLIPALKTEIVQNEKKYQFV